MGLDVSLYEVVKKDDYDTDGMYDRFVITEDDLGNVYYQLLVEKFKDYVYFEVEDEYDWPKTLDFHGISRDAVWCGSSHIHEYDDMVHEIKDGFKLHKIRSRDMIMKKVHNKVLYVAEVGSQRRGMSEGLYYDILLDSVRFPDPNDDHNLRVESMVVISHQIDLDVAKCYASSETSHIMEWTINDKNFVYFSY